MRLCTAKQIRALETAAYENYGILPARLMDDAAEALYEAIVHDAPEGCEEVLILCGSGNNGADGYTLAALCRKRGIRANVISVFAPSSPLCRERAFTCNTLSSPLFAFEGNERVLCERLIAQAGVIIDCVFGIGYDTEREPDQTFLDLCKLLSETNAFLISADIPSGLDADTGKFYHNESGAALIFADVTITFTTSKPALETAPGSLAAGRVKIADVGIPAELVNLKAADDPHIFLTDASLRALLPARSPESSKANYGKLLSICGSPDMPGAACLAARGALRCGVGLLTCCGRETTLAVLKHHFFEPIYLPFFETIEGVLDLSRTQELLTDRLTSQTAVLIGCGITTSRDSMILLETVLRETSCPVVCDADAITLLAEREDLLETYGEKLILTPHPGEMGRLCKKSASDIQFSRIPAAKEFAERYGCVVVLKGNRTLIASPDGRLAINPFGNPGMAKAGMGDLLAGMIASFAAQGLSPFDAAALGVYLHSRAGDLASETFGEASMLTTDVSDCIHLALTE